MNEPLESSTGATRVETDQGAAYAKFLGNPEGPQALFCELLGTRAAQWLGLPTFDFAIVEVPEPGLVNYVNGATSMAGPAFLARAEAGSTWGGTADELSAVQNREALSGLIVLDTWLLNCDRFRPEAGNVRRNTRNVFLAERGAAKGKLNVLAMDHTHCFTCGRQLTKAIGHIDRAKDERLFGHFPEFRGYLTHEAVRVHCRRLLELTSATAECLLAGMPHPWDVSEGVKVALRGFLQDRALFVGQNVRKMLVDRGELQPELELGE